MCPPSQLIPASRSFASICGRTGALVQTVITWQDPSSREGTFSTLAVDSDQLAAAVLATEKMLNVVATRKKA